MGASKNDFDFIESLSWNHVITKVRSCNLGSGVAGSVQVFYGVWKDGKITDEVGLNIFGVANENCKTLKI